MLEPVTLPDLFSAISLPVLVAGATPCALPDGPRTDLFGRAVAPASPSAQPVSGGGVTDERHLWPVWFNLIRECRPHVIFGEQVESAINHGWLDLVQANLEGEGYACGAVGLPAGGVGAPHIRQRLWFVADTNGQVRREGECTQSEVHQGQGRAVPTGVFAEGRKPSQLADATSKRGDKRFELESNRWEGETKQNGLGGKFDQLGDSDDTRSQGRGVSSANNGGGGSSEQSSRTASATNGFWQAADWLPCRDGKARPVEPGTFPLAHGVPARVGRLRAYGNAIVPQVAAEVIGAFLDARP